MLEQRDRHDGLDGDLELDDKEDEQADGAAGVDRDCMSQQADMRCEGEGKTDSDLATSRPQTFESDHANPCVSFKDVARTRQPENPTRNSEPR